ncbi:MAG: flagellar export chaperone FliS [Candidatus Latescibacteria bacterium]|nr:flagellar export chaperone FliS [Candidatus Latescibacterota bacterium]
MVHQGIRHYQQTTICSQSPEQLIVMLYEGALRFLESARAAALNGDLPEMGRQVGRAQRIVLELQCSLDHAVGGEMAGNLEALYGFVLQELTALRLDAQTLHIDNCRRVLRPLLTAWRTIPPGTGETARRNAGRSTTGAGMDVASKPGTPGQESIPDPLAELSLAV